MSTAFYCQIDIKSSYGRSNIDYISTSYVNMPKISLNDRSLFGIKIQELSLTPNNFICNSSGITRSVDVNCKFKDDLVIEEIVKFAKKIESYITLLFAKFENNPQNGLCYAEINWETAKRWSMKISQVMKPFCNQEQWNIDDEYDHIIFSSYYEGIKANNVKSKYFHWFLILESLEKSKAYQNHFKERLFEESELERLAQEFKGNDDKYNAIMNLKGRTLKSRSEKLYEMLQLLGISSYHFEEAEHNLSKKLLKKIIDCRNNLFHQGKQFDENLLWRRLFPIVRTVVEALLQNPNFLDRI